MLATVSGCSLVQSQAAVDFWRLSRYVPMTYGDAVFFITAGVICAGVIKLRIFAYIKVRQAVGVSYGKYA